MSIYYTTEGQTIYDVAVAIYGTEDALGDLVLDNPTLDLNTTIPTGTAISYDETKVYLKPVIPVIPIIAARPKYSVVESQSVYDLAIQLYGDISGLLNLIGIITDLNSTPVKGTVITPADSDNYAANTFFQNYTVQTSSQIGTVVGNFIVLEDGFTFIAMEDGTPIATE